MGVWPGKNTEISSGCAERVRKAKMQMELNLMRVVQNNKKGFHRYTGQKRWAKETVTPLINKSVKAEVLSEFLTLVFTGCQASHATHIPEPSDRGLGNKISSV